MKYLIKFLLLVGISISTICHADVAVVVNPANANTVEDAELPRIFMGKLKKFNDGQSVTILNLSENSSIRTEFEDKVLNKTPNQIKAYWSKRMFSGKGKPPAEMDSDAAVISFVASNPGAIAYVDAGSVDDSVKVLKVF